MGKSLIIWHGVACVNLVVPSVTLYKLVSPLGHVYVNYYTINDDTLSYDANRSLFVENAGGKSVWSEAYSIHMMQSIMGFTDIILENEVRYWIKYKMVDYIGTYSRKGVRVGVSVTRAMNFVDPSLFTIDDAFRLLHKKLYGLVVSKKSVIKAQSFKHCILHIWCQTRDIANKIHNAYLLMMKKEEWKNTLMPELNLLLTVCNENFIYTDKR